MTTDCTVLIPRGPWTALRLVAPVCPRTPMLLLLLCIALGRDAWAVAQETNPSHSTSQAHQVEWLGTPWPARHPGQPVRRIVSLAPSLTEIVFALGVGERIVGVTRFDDYPAEVRTRARVGGFVDPDVEAVIALRPDVVMAVPTLGGRSQLETLQRLGMNVMIIPAENLADLHTAIRALAALLETPSQGAALDQRITQQLDQLQQQQRQHTALRIMWVVGHRPWVVAGPESFLSQLLPYVHGHNAVTRGSAFPALDLEAVVAYDPDVIIDLSMGQGTRHDIQAYWQRFTTLRAVREKRVVVMADDSALLRLGPRLPDGLQRLAAVLRDRSHHAP